MGERRTLNVELRTSNEEAGWGALNVLYALGVDSSSGAIALHDGVHFRARDGSEHVAGGVAHTSLDGAARVGGERDCDAGLDLGEVL